MKTVIEAQGWLQAFLYRQMSGLTGHIEECGYPFDRPWWGTENNNDAGENDEGVKSGWWTYEQTAYWLDGYLRCAVLLRDEEAIRRGRKIIESVFAKADEDGYLGPRFLKETTGWNRWPHVVFFRACMALYEYTRDEHILSVMKRHYLQSPCDYSMLRDVNNVEIMLFLYDKTKDHALLELAEKSYIDYNEKCDGDVCDRVALSDKQPYAHGVTYCEYSKLGALLYLYTSNEEYLNASKAAMDKAERLFMLPGGCICSNEFMISDHYMESYETCLLNDYPWALYALAKATGDRKYYDLIERCIYNAGLGSVTEDFRALQYFSCANQVIADATSNHNLFFRGSKWMSYRPNPGTECCPGNINRMMPNFILHMWERTENELRCHLYGASTYREDGIEITETTRYPFEEACSFTVKTQKAFDLKLRIPQWAKAFELCLNGVEQNIQAQDGYVVLPVRLDCVVTIAFETEIEKCFVQEGMYFRKGILVYALGGEELRKIDFQEERSNKEFPAYNMYPNFEWRYGVEKNCAPRFICGAGDYASERSEMPQIVLTAKHLPEWEYIRQKQFQRCTNLYKRVIKEVKDDVTFTPPLPTDTTKTGASAEIKLYPYGCCKMRITVFPKL